MLTLRITSRKATGARLAPATDRVAGAFIDRNEAGLASIAKAQETRLKKIHTIAFLTDARTLILMDMEMRHEGDDIYAWVGRTNGTVYRRIDLKTLPKAAARKAFVQIQAVQNVITQMRQQNVVADGVFTEVELDPAQKALFGLDLSRFDLDGDPYAFDIMVGQLVQNSRTVEGRGSKVEFISSSPALIKKAQDRLQKLHEEYGTDKKIFDTADLGEGFKRINLLAPEGIHPTKQQYNLALDAVSNDQAVNFMPLIRLATAIARSASDPSRNDALRRRFEQMVGPDHEVAPAVWAAILDGSADESVFKENAIRPVIDALLKNMAQIRHAALSLAFSA